MDSDFQLQVDLITTIKYVKNGLEGMEYKDEYFLNSNFGKLKILNHLQNKDILNKELEWAKNNYKSVQAVNF
ncbi:unnamed protein product [marine sediment metagenome]|uniref:Uncharacterized protein n=1 Tax=marine sediment metagenome TaxID=412755 RepID=X0U4D0_9ZZZZ